MMGVTLAMLQATGLPLEITGSESVKPRRVPGEMNKLEARYAARLDTFKMAGEIKAWWFEAIALRIGKGCFWHPDFLVEYHDGHIELHDTKGFVRDDALVKAKAVAAKFPFPVYHAMWVKKAWKIKRIG
jgi:hypothetical protein